MSAVIVASSAALLGTSSVDTPSAYDRYEFLRESIDGGVVDLTVDRPSATFFVNVTATDLGPQSVVTTTGAQALVEGTVESAGLGEGQVPPRVAVRITSTSGQVGFDEPISTSLSSSVALPFTGNCNDPRVGAACSARLSVEVRRADDGEAGGTLFFAWHFSLSATGQVERAGKEDALLGPFEPPWTVQVTEP
jgi:hypothetical protein